MEETTTTIIGIIVAIILMFIVPFILISERADDISELVVQTATAEFIDEIIKSGKITEDKYQNFILQLADTGNTYDVEMELKILDENTAKVLLASGEVELGNNTYYSIYTSQIEEMLGKSANSDKNGEGKILLKQGDGISITIKNSSQTMSQSLKSFYSGTRGNNTQIIVASASGTVAVNGN